MSLRGRETRKRASLRLSQGSVYFNALLADARLFLRAGEIDSQVVYDDVVALAVVPLAQTRLR